MKVVILAGGYGTRISEFTKNIPKPLIRIGEYPIIWHIMNHYAQYDKKEFIIAAGYKSQEIKNYFLNYKSLNTDFKINLKTGKLDTINQNGIDWDVSIFDTGIDTMTGGRLKRLTKYLNNETFMLTYGDAISNVNIHELLSFHHSHGKMVTITAVNKASQFGELNLENNSIKSFQEKPKNKNKWINGGYFIIEPRFLDLIKDDQTILEREPFEKVASLGELMAYKHKGSWECMDTLKDYQNLKKKWSSELGWIYD